MRIFVITLSLLIFGLCIAQNYSVDEITLECPKDTTFIRIFTGGTPQYSKFTIENPPKLGIDIQNGINKLPSNDYFKVPPGLVMAIRTSQYKPLPEPVVRIVFDMVELPKNYSIRTEGEAIVIAIPSKSYPQFARWTSGRKEKEKVTPQKAETVSVAPTITAKPETTAKPPVEPEAPAQQPASAESILTAAGVPPPPAWMRPETLRYKGITMENETVEVAQYIRQIVRYMPPTSRDPFVRPTRVKKMPLGMEPLPAVEHLTLVGVAMTSERNMAIFQDNRGYGYILSPGDSVEDGICLEINDTTAIFEVEEFGQKRKIIVPLPKKEGQ